MADQKKDHQTMEQKHPNPGHVPDHATHNVKEMKEEAKDGKKEIALEKKAEEKKEHATPVKEVHTKEVVKESKITDETRDTAAKKTKAKKDEKVSTSATPSKPVKKKGVKAKWIKKEKTKKTKEAKKIQSTLESKWKPVFWGRFGKKMFRARTNPKFDKWRKPRGEDMQQKRDDGAVVAVGYRGPKSIRFTHPSGFKEVMIYSKKDLDMIKPTQAGRFASGIGRKKRIDLIKYANEKKVYILN